MRCQNILLRWDADGSEIARNCTATAKATAKDETSQTVQVCGSCAHYASLGIVAVRTTKPVGAFDE